MFRTSGAKSWFRSLRDSYYLYKSFKAAISAIFPYLNLPFLTVEKAFQFHDNGEGVKKDNVIDVNDALFIQKYWKTNKCEADINYDGVVDEKGMQYM